MNSCCQKNHAVIEHHMYLMSIFACILQLAYYKDTEGEAEEGHMYNVKCSLEQVEDMDELGGLA